VKTEGSRPGGFGPDDMIPAGYHSPTKVVGIHLGEVWILRHCATILSSGLLAHRSQGPGWAHVIVHLGP
jgi:hypothetical protein